MIGVLALLAAIREDVISQGKATELRKTEIILSNAGLPVAQIATLLGKKPNTISKTIQRAGKTSKGESDADE
jgi:IS30 family transposase